MTQRPRTEHRALPDGTRIDLLEAPTPEFVRWLYAAVGGPWRWTDRLGWARDQWAQELAQSGAEVHVLYVGGAPAGYVQLGATVTDTGSSVQIAYFGLLEHAIGRGLGGALLAYAVEVAWSLSERRGLAPVSQVWLHTCDLDGPHALANYQARGFRVTGECTEDEDYPETPLGAWASTGGPA